MAAWNANRACCGVLFSVLLLLLLLFAGAISAADPDWPPIHHGNAAEQKLLAELDKPIDLDFEETPLSDISAFIKDRRHINLSLDDKALDEIGIAGDTPVTFSSKGSSLAAGLHTMLRKIDPQMTFIVHDEQILITTRDVEESIFIERVYDVSAIAKNDLSGNRLIASLERLYGRTPLQPRQPSTDAGPRLAMYQRNLMVRGTEAEHEAVVRCLRALKSSLDGAKASEPADPWAATASEPKNNLKPTHATRSKERHDQALSTDPFGPSTAPERATRSKKRDERPDPFAPNRADSHSTRSHKRDAERADDDIFGPDTSSSKSASER